MGKLTSAVRKYLPMPVMAATAFCLLLCATDAAQARAGGGGSARGRLIVTLIALPIAVVYALILQRMVAKRGEESEALLRRLARTDPIWEPKAIEARVRAVFFKVQDAWTKRDHEDARACMTEALYEEHKAQTDRMIADHQRNVLSDITLSEVTVVGVTDRMDDACDSFWVWLQGAMVDYVIDVRDEKVVRGEKARPTYFHEIWRFDRAGDTWLLGEIKQESASGINALQHMRAISDSLGAGRKITVVGSNRKR